MNTPDSRQIKTSNQPKHCRTSSSEIILGLLCLLIGTGLRLYFIQSQFSQLTVDRDAYLGIAHSLADGRGYSSPDSTVPTAFRPPVYPLVLSALFRFMPVPWAVAAVNLISGALTIGCVLSLGRRFQMGRLRFLAALLVAVDPLLLQYAARPMTESLCTALAAVWMLLATKSSETGSRHPYRDALLSGMSLGLLVICRPTFWTLTGLWIFLGVSLMRKLHEPVIRSKIRCGMVSVVGFLLMTLPWAIRNSLVMGSFILTTTHGGYTLLLGNNDVFYQEVVNQPFGTTWPDASQHAWEAQLEAELRENLTAQATEPQRDAWQSKKARTWIWEHPAQAFRAASHRMQCLWNTVPQGDAASGVSPRILLVVRIFYLVVLIGSVIGSIVVPYHGQFARWWTFYAIVSALEMVHLFYWTNTRMRAPLTPALDLMAAAVFLRMPKESNQTAEQTPEA